MVALWIVTELMGVGPVDLARSRQIVFRLPSEGFQFARVPQRQELDPLPARELLLLLQNWRRGVDRAIAGEHAPAKKIFGLRVDCVLEVPVKETCSDALFEHGHEVIDANHLDDPLDFASHIEPQGDRRDDTKKTVAADNQLKYFGIFLAAAMMHVAL